MGKGVIRYCVGASNGRGPLN